MTADPAVLELLEQSAKSLHFYKITIRQEPDLVEAIEQLTAAVKLLAEAD